MNKRRPYPPAVTPAKGKRPGTEKFMELARRRWQFVNLGTWAVRDIRDKPGQLSVHATGRAMDLGYADRTKAVEAMNWFVEHNTALGVTLVNDYMHGSHGRTWKCDRQAWLVHKKPTIGGRGHWFHVELEPWAADDPALLEKVWRSLPRP